MDYCGVRKGARKQQTSPRSKINQSTNAILMTSLNEIDVDTNKANNMGGIPKDHSVK